MSIMHLVTWLSSLFKRSSNIASTHAAIELCQIKGDGEVKAREESLLQGWPEASQRLKGVSALYYSGDCFLVLFPFAFIGEWVERMEIHTSICR